MTPSRVAQEIIAQKRAALSVAEERAVGDVAVVAEAHEQLIGEGGVGRERIVHAGVVVAGEALVERRGVSALAATAARTRPSA